MILYGTYLEEGTTRFVAWAEVAGKRQRCYVPMSCKLSSLLPDLKGASVLLEQTKKACALVAVKLRGRGRYSGYPEFYPDYPECCPVECGASATHSTCLLRGRVAVIGEFEAVVWYNSATTTEVRNAG